MANLVIGLISFAGIFGGVLIGLFAGRRLPGRHLDSQTQSAVDSVGRRHRHVVGVGPRVNDHSGEQFVFVTFGSTQRIVPSADPN